MCHQIFFPLINPLNVKVGTLKIKDGSHNFK
jgi:hypothetical protein